MALQNCSSQQIVCPACRTTFKAAGVPAGKRLRCTRCDHRFTLPPRPVPAPPAPRPVAIPVSAGPARPVAIPVLAGPARPVAIPVPARSGMKMGRIAAILLVAAVLVGGSTLVATRFGNHQSDTAPGPDVAREGGGSAVSGGDERAGGSTTDADRNDRQGDSGTKSGSPPKDDANEVNPGAGRPARGNAKQLAKQRLDEAAMAYKEARALYDADETRYVQERNLALATNGNRGAMGLPPLMVRPVDPVLSARMNAAFQLYREAKRVYEETK